MSDISRLIAQAQKCGRYLFQDAPDLPECFLAFTMEERNSIAPGESVKDRQSLCFGHNIAYNVMDGNPPKVVSLTVHHP